MKPSKIYEDEGGVKPQAGSFPGSIMEQLYALSKATRVAAETEILNARSLDIRAWLVLRSIGEFKFATQRQIASATCLDKVAVSRAVSWLKEREFAVPHPNVLDGRSHLLELSLAGEQILASCTREIAVLERELLAGLSENESSVLANLLKHLQGTVKGMAGSSARC